MGPIRDKDSPLTHRNGQTHVEPEQLEQLEQLEGQDSRDTITVAEE